mmetsp:Transcript_1150/g.1883  ORF Transcript_1150/g.1883 Transcript_1150/m.1883 type:complete len:110 (-) Transcript_1150:12-341(-)
MIPISSLDEDFDGGIGFSEFDNVLSGNVLTDGGGGAAVFTVDYAEFLELFDSASCHIYLYIFVCVRVCLCMVKDRRFCLCFVVLPLYVAPNVLIIVLLKKDVSGRCPHR